MKDAPTPGAGPTLPLRFSYPVVVLVALVLPGIASLMLRGWKEAGLRSLLLLAAIPVALFVFGPLWDGVIFAKSSRAVRNFGLWPFVATCVAVMLFSVWRAIQDRRVVIARLEASGDATDVTGVSRAQTRSESFGYGCFGVAALLLAIRFLALPAMLNPRGSLLAQLRTANTVAFLQGSCDVAAALLVLLGAYLVWRGRRRQGDAE
jgi:hypothetical protein